MRQKLNKKSDKIDRNNSKDINSKIVEELLSRADPSELFGKNGIFEQLKKQIVERVLASELEHELGYSKHSKLEKMDSNRRNGCAKKRL
jgi:putative transposase